MTYLATAIASLLAGMVIGAAVQRWGATQNGHHWTGVDYDELGQPWGDC